MNRKKQDRPAAGAGRESEKTPLYFYFGEKLTAMTSLLKMTNSFLARKIDVDPSIVSRFKNGNMIPTRKEITLNISEAIIEAAIGSGKTGEFERVTGISVERFDSRERLTETFNDWLTDNTRVLSPGDVKMLISSFDRYLSSLSKDKERNVPAKIVPEETVVLEKGDKNYFGKKGLREAALRLLTLCAANEATEFLVYSDQETDWITEDPVFFDKLKVLLARCLSKGSRIKIIHQLSRFDSELKQSSELWLPLYFSAAVDPYVSTRNADMNFSHFLFIARGLACIEGTVIRGAAGEAFYNYTDDPARVLSYEKQFDALLSYSKRFARVENRSQTEKILVGFKNRFVISPTLTMPTMPEKLLKKLMLRKKVPDSVRSATFDLWKKARAELFRSLADDSLTECFPLIYNSETDIPFFRVRYTKEEFAEHLREILRITSKYPSYKVVILDKRIYKNTRISVADSSVNFTSTGKNGIIFSVMHPSIIKAFGEYASDEVKKHSSRDQDPESEIKKYIKDLF